MTDSELFNKLVCEILEENAARIEQAFAHRRYPMTIKGKWPNLINLETTGPIRWWVKLHTDDQQSSAATQS